MQYNHQLVAITHELIYGVRAAHHLGKIVVKENNSIANALGLPQSCTKPLISSAFFLEYLHTIYIFILFLIYTLWIFI